MQFQLLVAEALKNDLAYNSLKSQLILNQKKCLKLAKNAEQQSLCKSKQQQFETYLSEYSYQYKEKGRKMCSQVMRQHHDLPSKIKSKDECIQFYHKSIDIFQKNVKEKLRSLVDNIDFSQL